MNKLILMSLLVVCAHAIAADKAPDAKNEDTTSTSTSTNLMGTKTTTRKVKKEKVAKDGTKTELNMTDKKKKEKNGEKTETVDIDKKKEKN